MWIENEKSDLKLTKIVLLASGGGLGQWHATDSSTKVQQAAVRDDSVFGPQQALASCAQQRRQVGHTGPQLPVQDRPDASAYFQQMFGSNVRVFTLLEWGMRVSQGVDLVGG